MVEIACVALRQPVRSSSIAKQMKLSARVVAFHVGLNSR
jgi:hypothetical protein